MFILSDGGAVCPNRKEEKQLLIREDIVVLFLISGFLLKSFPGINKYVNST